MSEAAPLLTTRLMPRIQRKRLVQRPALLTQLDGAWEHPLTLVCAPAGFGKTTLLVSWLQQQPHPVIWLTLEQSDTLQARFWHYLIAAFQTVSPNFGAQILTQMQNAPLPTDETVVNTLLIELTLFDQDVVLILDDYHVLPADAAIHTALSYLVEHLPEHVHLVISSRSDPMLPLARLRVRGQLLEIRAGHLRFNVDETRAFLAEKMQLPVSDDEVSLLLNRTEGWIAGIQMAALSMQGRDDLHSFVQRFSGDHRYILDYLNDEVLARQPEHLRDFLLRTSILRRLSAPICNALTGRSDSQSILEGLERDNLFVVALDDQRQQYRYHHLFSDLLRRRLGEQPGLMETLCQRTAAWFEAQSCLEEAADYALIAGDFEHAARLMEAGGWVTAMRRGDATGLIALIPLVKRFPAEVIHNHPRLVLNQAMVLVSTTKYREAEQLLDDLESRLTEDNPAMLGEIATMRALISVLSYQPHETMTYLNKAFALLPPQAVEWRGFAAWSMANAYRQTGNSPQAAQAFEEILPWLTADPGLQMVTRANLAEQLRLQGRLREAHETHAATIRENEHAGFFQLAASYIFGCETLLEWNRLDEARSWIAQGLKHAHAVGSLELLVFSGFAHARILEACGDNDGALKAVSSALAVHNDVPYLQHYLQACQAWLYLQQSDLDRAEQWVQARGFAVDDEIRYLDEYEYSVFARWLLKTDAPRASLHLLQRLAAQAESGGRLNDVITYRVLQALAHRKLNEPQRAHECMLQVLHWALPQGYTRVFINEGREMAELLAGIAAQITLPRPLADWIRNPLQSQHGSLAEPLTGRELEVLRLIAIGFSNQEIADNLIVSVNTVKTHIKHLYEKFNVGNRVALVEQARTANLI